MFKHSPYSLIRGDFVKMDEHCSVCGYRFCMEPGFFIGAAYVNYAFFIVILLTTYFTGRFFFSKVEALTIFYIVLGLVLSLFPLLFRYSRVVYSYLFSGVKYDPRAAEK
tara:strand:- start:38 stop:364 length:327 start_codon:yes stop_codon:yes gene_type:complete